MEVLATFLILLLMFGAFFFGKILKTMEKYNPAFLTARFLTLFRLIMMLFSVGLTNYMFAIYGESFINKYNFTANEKVSFLTIIIIFGLSFAIVIEMALITAEKTIGYIDNRKKALIYLSSYLFLIVINILTMSGGLNKTTDELAQLAKKSIEKSESIKIFEEKRKLLLENKKNIQANIETLKKEKEELIKISPYSAKIGRYKREITYLKANMSKKLQKLLPKERYPTKRAEIKTKYEQKIAYWQSKIDEQISKLKTKNAEKIAKINEKIMKEKEKIEKINEKIEKLITEKENKKEAIKEKIKTEEEEKFYRNWKIVFGIQFFNLISGVLSALLRRTEEDKMEDSSLFKARIDGKEKQNRTIMDNKADDEQTLFNLVYEIAREESEKANIWKIIDGKSYLKHISRDKLKRALQDRGVKWNGNYNEFYARYSKNKKDLFITKGNERVFKKIEGTADILNSIKI